VIRTDPALVGRFAAYANRTFWRNPAAAFFTLFLPVFFLVLFSVLFGNELVSNVFIPFSNQPRWLDILTSVLPIKPFNEALKTAIVPPLGSNGFNGGDLLELAVWGVVGAVVAFRYFSWEPHP
jgi:hypothetical protein